MSNYGTKVLCVCEVLQALFFHILSNTLAQLSVTTFEGVEKDDFFLCKTFFFFTTGKQDQGKTTIRALIRVSSITQKCRGWRWFNANCLGGSVCQTA